MFGPFGSADYPSDPSESRCFSNHMDCSLHPSDTHKPPLQPTGQAPEKNGWLSYEPVQILLSIFEFILHTHKRCCLFDSYQLKVMSTDSLSAIALQSLQYHIVVTRDLYPR